MTPPARQEVESVAENPIGKDFDDTGNALYFGYTRVIAGGSCIVCFHDDRPNSIQLLGADSDIAPLDEAAERFDLDAEGLRAAARAALAAPDREINIEVGRNLADAEREAEAAAATPRSG